MGIAPRISSPHMRLAAITMTSLTLVLALSVPGIPGGEAAAAAVSPPSAERQAEIQHMVRQECGACHGMRLEGGLGPALTPEALADRSRPLLVRTILQGRPGAAMPPWKPFLERSEVVWLVRQLKQGELDER